MTDELSIEEIASNLSRLEREYKSVAAAAGIASQLVTLKQRISEYELIIESAEKRADAAVLASKALIEKAGNDARSAQARAIAAYESAQGQVSQLNARAIAEQEARLADLSKSVLATQENLESVNELLAKAMDDRANARMEAEEAKQDLTTYLSDLAAAKQEMLRKLS